MPAYKCTEGSDETCTNLSSTSCCMYMEVTAVLSEQNDKEKTTLTDIDTDGYPVKEGESEFLCMTKKFYDLAAEGGDIITSAKIFRK